MSNTRLKRCSKGEYCVHPDGCWQPATPSNFYRKKHKKDGLSSWCKACDDDYSRTYRNNHGEQVRDGNRRRAARFRDVRADHLREYRRNWRQSTIGRASINSYSKQYYQRAEVKQRQRLYAANRRARERAAGGTYTADDIRILYKSQRGRCWWCGKRFKGDHYHIDHRIPLSRGGSNAAENLCLACPSCNHSKSDKMPWEWKDRLL